MRWRITQLWKKIELGKAIDKLDPKIDLTIHVSLGSIVKVY